MLVSFRGGVSSPRPTFSRRLVDIHPVLRQPWTRESLHFAVKFSLACKENPMKRLAIFALLGTAYLPVSTVMCVRERRPWSVLQLGELQACS
jgi:hypothetical protein